MLPGLSFRETLKGRYWWLDAPTEEWAIAVRLYVDAADMRAFARRKAWRVTGTIDAERLATSKGLEGTVGSTRLDARRLSYRLTFVGDDGLRYEVSGQKEWSGLAPIASITMLPASLYDSQGNEIARMTLRFDLRTDGLSWAKSLRFKWPGRSRGAS